MALDDVNFASEVEAKGVLNDFRLQPIAEPLAVPEEILETLIAEQINQRNTPSTFAKNAHDRDEELLRHVHAGADGGIANLGPQGIKKSAQERGDAKKKNDAKDAAFTSIVTSLIDIEVSPEDVKSVRNFFDNNASIAQKAEMAAQAQNFINAETPEAKTEAAMGMTKQYMDVNKNNPDMQESPEKLAKASLEATKEHLIEAYIDNGRTREQAETIVNPIINAISTNPEQSEELTATAKAGIESFSSAKNLSAGAADIYSSIEMFKEARLSEIKGIPTETPSEDLANQTHIQIQEKIAELEELLAERDNLETKMQSDPAFKDAFQNSLDSLNQQITVSKVELFQTSQQIKAVADEIQADIAENIEIIEQAQERYAAKNGTDFPMPLSTLDEPLSPEYDPVQEYSFALPQMHAQQDTLNMLQKSIDQLIEAVEPEAYANLEANQHLVNQHESASNAANALTDADNNVAQAELDTQLAEQAEAASKLTEVIAGEYNSSELEDVLLAKSAIIKAYATKVHPDGMDLEKFEESMEYVVGSMIGREVPEEYMDALKEKFIENGGTFVTETSSIETPNGPSVDQAQLTLDDNPELKSYVASLAELTHISEADMSAELEARGLSPDQAKQVMQIAETQMAVNIAPKADTTVNNTFSTMPAANRNSNDPASGAFNHAAAVPKPTTQSPAPKEMTPEEIKLAATEIPSNADTSPTTMKAM